MANESTPAQTPVTVELRCAYKLSDDAHRALALAGTPTSRVQTISITVDAATAISRGLAVLRDDGSIVQRSDLGICGDGEVHECVVLEHGHGGITHVYSYATDHVLTSAEAIAVYEAAAHRTEAELTAAAAAKAERENAYRLAHEKAQAALVAGIEEDLPRLQAGEGIINSGYPGWYELREKHVTLRNRSDGAEAPYELCRKIQAIRDARDKANSARLAEATLLAEAERSEWISAHGSERLKKGLSAGLVAKMGGVYRTERIVQDLGAEWKSWDAVKEDEEVDRLNPSEAELDALLDVRAKWPDAALEVQLRSVRRTPDVDDEHEDRKATWRPALMMRLPWEREKWGVRYLDADK